MRAVMGPDIAVTVVRPSDLPVIVPDALTDATEGSADTHVTRGEAASVPSAVVARTAAGLSSPLSSASGFREVTRRKATAAGRAGELAGGRAETDDGS